MRESIRKQLEACVFANLNNYDEKTNTFFIPRYSKPKYDIGKCYLIKLPNYFVADNITANWNNGIKPKYQYLKIYVSTMLGTMIKVDAIYFDMNTRQDIPNETFSGYLDTKEIEQIAIL